MNIMVRKLQCFYGNYLGKWRIKNMVRKQAASGEKIRIVIGCGTHWYGEKNGWIETDFPYFDATNKWDWEFIFGKNRVDNLLAEHVLEHLTKQQTENFFRWAFKYLKPSGILRIAVPDGMHPDPNYIKHVKPGGTGPGCDDHKMLYDYKMFNALAEQHGFCLNLLEYFDETQKFHYNEYSFEHGCITRSKKNGCCSESVVNYTSLIADFC